MAIQPIDLQTLYSQIEKIGKTQVQQQVASQSARDAELIRNKVQAEEKQHTVQELESGDERAGAVHGKKSGEDASTDGGKKQKNNHAKSSDTEEISTVSEVIRDPALGTRIDISG